MKKVVILGGSFDPVHNGHIDILKAAITNLSCDEGWLMLAPSPRWKNKYASLNFRLRLLSYVEKNEKNIKVCKDELELKGTTYTYNTFLKLKEKYQGDACPISSSEIAGAIMSNVIGFNR